MHIKQLECFVHLAETLNFSRTAELLYITQPTVTHQINTLEAELKSKLFIRNKRKVELTPAGLSFYQDVKDILARTNIAITKTRTYSQTFESNLAIGYDPHVEIKPLPHILRTFKAKFPHVYLSLRMTNFKEKWDLLTNFKFDLVFTSQAGTEDVAGIEYTELFTGKFVCILPREHPLAQQKLIQMADLKNQSLILLDPLKCPPEMTRVQNALHLNCPDCTVYFSDNAAISYAMIKGTLGIAIIPEFACLADPEVAMIPLDIAVAISYGIAWNKKQARSEIKNFISITKQSYCMTS